MYKDKKTGFSFGETVLSPTEQIKRYIVQLSKECTDHLSRSNNDNKERYAFAMKVRVLATMLESYTPKDGIEWKLQHYKELEEEINMIETNTSYSQETKDVNMIKKQFRYATPVFFQSLKVLQNSPIVEIETEGVIDLSSKDIEKRIQTGTAHYSSGVPVAPIRGESGQDIEMTVEESEDD